MSAETTVKRIGGSTFALLPPDLVRSQGLQPGDRVQIEVKRLGGTVEDLLKLWGKYPNLPKFNRREMWGE